MKTTLFPSGRSFARENVITNVSFCNGKKKKNYENKYKFSYTKNSFLRFERNCYCSSGLEENHFYYNVLMLLSTIEISYKKNYFINILVHVLVGRLGSVLYGFIFPICPLTSIRMTLKPFSKILLVT